MMQDRNQEQDMGDAQPPKNRSFFYLLLGGFISMVGDQFTLIGLPWLTLKVTGDPLALGLVLAIIGIPRAVFVLLGGAIVDKYSPKGVLLISKYVNTMLLGLLATLVYQGMLTLALLYILAAAIGLSSAFAFPASTSLLPFVVPRERLAQANGMMMGMRQVTFFIGPLIAGLVIAWFGNGASTNAAVIEDNTGLAMVFALDAISFLLSAFTLYKVGVRSRTDVKHKKSSVWSLLFEGFRSANADQELKSVFLYMALIQMFVVGPLQVGLPVLAEQRLDGGAASFGIIMASHGIGTLLGLVLAGAGMSLGFRSLGWMLLCVDATIGFAVAGFGLVTSTPVGGTILFFVGILGGMVQVKVFSWLQHRTPEAQMGRVMSLFMFIVMGVAPVAASAGGWFLARSNVTDFFIASGAAMTLLALAAMLVPALRRAGKSIDPISEPQE